MYEIQSVPTTKAHLRNWPLAGKLKVCTLCGTLNIAENEECFACRWHGAFETSPTMVRMRLAELAIQCPDVMELWERPAPKPVHPLMAWLNRALSWMIAQLRSSRVDLRA